MTQPTQTKEKILKETNETSPAFVHAIDPVDFLTTLDGFIHQLNDNPTSNTADNILKDLRGYQIMSIEYAGQKRWITGPMTIKKQTVKNDLFGRINHLIKSGGEWRAETAQKDRVEVPSCAVLPITIPISQETRREMNSDSMINTSVTSILLFLTALHTNLMATAEIGGIGVFERPYGATNVNRMVGWLERHNDHSAWGMRNTITSHSLDELADDAIFSVAK